MKAYVLYYGPEPQSQEEESKEEREGRLARPNIVEFGKNPGWKIPSRYEANAELRILAGSGVFVGQHFCKFSVEELPEGAFAIVCSTHPETNNVVSSK